MNTDHDHADASTEEYYRIWDALCNTQGTDENYSPATTNGVDVYLQREGKKVCAATTSDPDIAAEAVRDWNDCA